MVAIMARTIKEIYKIYKMLCTKYIFTPEIISLFQKDSEIKGEQKNKVELESCTDELIYRVCFIINRQDIGLYNVFAEQEAQVRLEFVRRYMIMNKCISKINSTDMSEQAELTENDTDIIIDILIKEWRKVSRFLN